MPLAPQCTPQDLATPTAEAEYWDRPYRNRTGHTMKTIRARQAAGRGIDRGGRRQLSTRICWGRKSPSRCWALSHSVLPSLEAKTPPAPAASLMSPPDGHRPSPGLDTRPTWGLPPLADSDTTWVWVWALLLPLGLHWGSPRGSPTPEHGKLSSALATAPSRSHPEQRSPGEGRQRAEDAADVVCKWKGRRSGRDRPRSH